MKDWELVAVMCEVVAALRDYGFSSRGHGCCVAGSRLLRRGITTFASRVLTGEKSTARSLSATLLVSRSLTVDFTPG